jgi:hypothetical protein
MASPLSGCAKAAQPPMPSCPSVCHPRPCRASDCQHPKPSPSAAVGPDDASSGGRERTLRAYAPRPETFQGPPHAPKVPKAPKAHTKRRRPARPAGARDSRGARRGAAREGPGRR